MTNRVSDLIETKQKNDLYRKALSISYDHVINSFKGNAQNTIRKGVKMTDSEYKKMVLKSFTEMMNTSLSDINKKRDQFLRVKQSYALSQKSTAGLKGVKMTLGNSAIMDLYNRTDAIFRIQYEIMLIKLINKTVNDIDSLIS
jgi:hypothetical protein